MAMPGSTFTPTPLGHEGNLGVSFEPTILGLEVQHAKICATRTQRKTQRLNQVDLYAWKTVHCITLESRHRRKRLRWCKEHVGWDYQKWSTLMFSDESRRIWPPITVERAWNTL
ncbi:hypothetical protein TNCV_772621 [Trichonephila clavipes]|nr:hypothetical protein TNCV_772621 [Trichonephila clavipes]